MRTDIRIEEYRVDLEEHLHRNGTRIIKFFLHLSKDERRKRFRDRIDEPENNWKFSLADVRERESWSLDMQAYEACLSATSIAAAPWYVVPADDKKNARLIISQILLDTFNDLEMAYPAEEAGALSIQVRDPNESKRLMEAIIACLDGAQPATPPKGDAPVSGFQLQRLGMIMEPEPGNPLEVEGTLNPAVVRGPDDQLYLFPRLVANGNYSRIGIARVQFNQAGDPCGVERLGIALEPETDYELRPDGRGGCEDPRVTFVEAFQRYVMTYAALSPIGPRIALAVSEDLIHWRRLGLATFEPYACIDFVHVDNKDASLFPVAIPNHAGKMQLAILHRPLFPGTLPEETACQAECRLVDLDHESIWISYCPMTVEDLEPDHLGLFNSHHRLATPVSPWERLKIGGGTPPILTRHGWLIVYHGVSEMAEPGNEGRQLCYSAGVMVLSQEHPRVLRYRSPEPVLTPELPQERYGTIANVVFPTGIDRRDDLRMPNRFDVYYGMADRRIGVARLDMPGHLPPGEVADPPAAKV